MGRLELNQVTTKLRPHPRDEETETQERTEPPRALEPQLSQGQGLAPRCIPSTTLPSLPMLQLRAFPCPTHPPLRPSREALFSRKPPLLSQSCSQWLLAATVPGHGDSAFSACHTFILSHPVRRHTNRPHFIGGWGRLRLRAAKNQWLADRVHPHRPLPSHHITSFISSCPGWAR